MLVTKRPRGARHVVGFTLIEIAVVLFIVAIVMGAITALINTLMVNQRLSATRTQEDAIKAALISFINRNNRLPCPANPTLLFGDANEGLEVTPAGTCTGAILFTPIPPPTPPDLPVVTGTLPWKSIGLPSGLAKDAYQNRFTYQVVLAATNLNSQNISGLKGSIAIYDSGSLTNQTNDCKPAGTIYNPCSGVVVVVSHGADGYGAYADSGLQIPFEPSITGLDEKQNALSTHPNQFVVAPFSSNQVNPYDDIVSTLTTNDLLPSLANGGSIKNAYAALNNNFDTIKNAVVIYAIANKTPAACSTGCTYPLPPDLPTLGLGLAATADPWGQQIIYTPNVPSVDDLTLPGTQIFSMASKGPDVTVGGNDDVTVNVNETDFITARSNTGL